MKSEVKKAGIKCKKCGSELLVLESKVFCQICPNPDGSYTQVEPVYTFGLNDYLVEKKEDKCMESNK